MKRPAAKDILYILACVIMVGGTALFLSAWWNHFRQKSPPVVVGTPFVFREEVPFECRLVWDEEILRAPGDGSVHYPGGRKPHLVKKDDLLVVVRGGGRSWKVRAPGVGYFVGGSDGLEGRWDYLSLWRGEGPLPDVPELTFLPEGASVLQGRIVGKFLPQPQKLRAVGYVDGTKKIIEEIHRGVLDLRRRALDLPFAAPVRVARPLGWRRKVYLTLPLFPPDFLRQRSLDLSLCLARLTGVLVPEAAIFQRGGIQGLFVVEGQICRFRQVDGRPVGEGKFLVTEGLRSGEIVVAEARRAKEGKVQLW